MRDLPLVLAMRGRPAAVVGAGVVAARRAELLVRCGARVTVFASALGDEFRDLRDKPNFRHAERDPTPDDLSGASLCFVATEDEALIASARAAAKAAGALVNVADRPKLSDFTMPSIVDRSPLVIAVSTGGASPILGRLLKARLEVADPRVVRPARRADGRLSPSGRSRDPVADHAPPLLGIGARRPDRRSGALWKRSRRRVASIVRDRPLGRRAPVP